MSPREPVGAEAHKWADAPGWWWHRFTGGAGRREWKPIEVYRVETHDGMPGAVGGERGGFMPFIDSEEWVRAIVPGDAITFAPVASARDDASRGASPVAWGVADKNGALFETDISRRFCEENAERKNRPGVPGRPYTVVPLYAHPAPSAARDDASLERVDGACRQCGSLSPEGTHRDARPGAPGWCSYPGRREGPLAYLCVECGALWRKVRLPGEKADSWNMVSAKGCAGCDNGPRPLLDALYRGPPALASSPAARPAEDALTTPPQGDGAKDEAVKWSLCVNYLDPSSACDLDEALRGVVGATESYAGRLFAPDNPRDLGWWFETEEEALEAAERVKRLVPQATATIRRSPRLAALTLVAPKPVAASPQGDAARPASEDKGLREEVERLRAMVEMRFWGMEGRVFRAILDRWNGGESVDSLERDYDLELSALREMKAPSDALLAEMSKAREQRERADDLENDIRWALDHAVNGVLGVDGTNVLRAALDRALRSAAATTKEGGAS